uniref:CMP/dCMP-type deaminase domain-containing protein n=1 Tax=Caenorhabditis tropicalis TaxID=1561998 RepID=A0A1I7SZ59_9PELO
MQEEPPQKIRKINRSLVTRIEVVPILDPKLTCETVASTSFQALQLKSKKKLIIGRLKDLPESFQHLKRVGKDGSILISQTEETAKEIISDLNSAEARIENLITVQVPSIKPSTRRQFEFAKQLWPTGFHPNHELEQLLDDSFLTPTFKEYISHWVQETLDIDNGCVAVQNNTLLSIGRPSNHPLGHPVMEMVKNLPKRTGSDYLGTGSDVFLVYEPCAMCSMALVHFRVRRLFYVHDSKNGVLKEDGWQLHLEPSINHHYEVFRVKITEDPETNHSSNSYDSCKNSK